MSFKVLGVQHIAIATESKKPIVESLKKLFDISPTHEETVESQQVITEFFKIGSVPFELLEPLSPESPISKFLSKRGTAVHHIAVEVDDIKAAIAHLLKEGVKMIDEMPRPGAQGCWTAFLHPKSFHGLLIELVQKK